MSDISQIVHFKELLHPLSGHKACELVVLYSIFHDSQYSEHLIINACVHTLL